ncbi:MAG: hypothetical protein M3Q37_12685 [Gemmatimonadota bacterium]|nr:hypothetical protein [Gemmatimonadota bacterium]
MATRIIFNGQEYDSPEAMPPDVRKAYQVMLDQFQDRDKDGIPDVLQGGSAGKNVLGMLQTSVTFNGRTLEGMGLPAPVRRLIGNVIAHGISKGTAPAEPHGNEPLVRALDTASRATGGPFGMLLAFVAGCILIFSVGLIFAIGGGREHWPGRLTVAIAALLLLGWLDTQATRLARRREPLLGPNTAGYSRFLVWSSLGLCLAAVLLFGLAWFLP